RVQRLLRRQPSGPAGEGGRQRHRDHDANTRHSGGTLASGLETLNQIVMSSVSRDTAPRTHSVPFSFQSPHPLTAMIPVLVVLGILLLVIVVLGAWAAGIYNTLVALRNRFKNAFAQIDVQLKRRYDVIPNLVETAKGYLKHEHDTLEAVIKARNIAYTASQAAAANPADGNAM